jgi:hypothetical protein
VAGGAGAGTSEVRYAGGWVDADEGEARGTKELQAIMLADEAGVPAGDYRDWDAEQADAYVQSLLAKRSVNRSVNWSADRSADGAESTPSAQPSALLSASGAELRHSGDLRELAENVKKTHEKVPLEYRPELKNALQLYIQNGRKVTPAIRERYGFDSGDRFGQIAAWLKAAAALGDAVRAARK